ncbi:MAG: hypothetical protein OXG43_10770 [Chloroflexi bacterium]|nr:hypothetical protein [Chloroflexota bacterium]
MTMVLAMDTTGSAPAMAVLHDDEVLASWQGDTARTPLISGLRAMQAGQNLPLRELRGRLSTVAAAMGPGRYARLRAGVAFAKGLATGLGVPFVGVRSAAAVARAAGGHVGPIVIPAGRGRVYFWTCGRSAPLGPAIGPPELAAQLGAGVTVAGDVDDDTAEGIRAAGMRLRPIQPVEVAQALGRLAGERDPSIVGVGVARPIYAPAAGHG